jgi:peroxiredoxin
MVELGELERRYQDIAQHNARVVVASVESVDDAKQTQQDFSHLIVLADADQRLVSATEVGHPGAGQHGEDIAAPTTVFVDKHGVVRWFYRPREVISRLSVDELLTALESKSR